MNKTDLISKIKQLDGLTQDERATLIDLVNTKKKYGLVWEDKPEEVEEQLRTHLPVLREVVERRILSEPTKKKSEPGFTGLKDSPESKKSKPLQASLFEETENQGNQENQINQSSDNGSLSGVEAPNHILIEGDNLHALTALTFTHEGRIDVIYIDPPYNTGKAFEFRYNDRWIDKNDPFRHSSWLAFMSKRLQIAKSLMSESSAIFISIDNNEFSQLKLLCDEIFLEQNFFGSIIWRKKEGGGQTDAYFVTEHEYILCYKKGNFLWRDQKIEDFITSFNKDDERGSFKLVKLEKWGSAARQVDRPTMHFALITPDGNDFFPSAPDGSPGRYRVGKSTMNQIINERRIHWERRENKWIPYEKVYHEQNKSKIIKERSILYNLANTGDGSNELTEIFGVKDTFENPKPTKLIRFILEHASLQDTTFLDFFAGSGTTLHATIQLNAEDGGNRQCILVTNNENNICEEVTYERNKRVIQGYTNSKSQLVPGLTNNNLRYYKSEFVPSVKTEANKRLLTQTSTDLLCIKEDCYTECTEAEAFNQSQCRIFTNYLGKYLIVVYHSRKQLEVCEQLIGYIKSIQSLSEKIKLYAFSPEKETLLEDFTEVADLIEAVPLPEAIYNAYRATFRTLKLDQKQPATAVENELIDLTLDAE